MREYEGKKQVYLIGVGMGNPDLLTIEADQAVRGSGLILGARRLLEVFDDVDAPKEALVSSREIVEVIRNSEEDQIAVLLSGDTGFFSGAKTLYPMLEELDVDVETFPGISSLAYFCGKCQIPWQDVHVLSCHGRDGGVVAAVQSHHKTFVLTGGAFRVEVLCRQLKAAGLGHLRAKAGEWLSYPRERLVTGRVSELAEDAFADLSVLLVLNPNPVQPVFQAPGLPDDAFLRGKVPMTKEEVRTLAVSKLHLCSRDTLWDVGAGTGSVSVECALCLPEGSVYAVERRSEACDLIRQNREKFQLTNLYLTEGEAPEALEALPSPDSVFIGGSGGNLRDIIGAALEKNPAVRVVVSAITLETVSEALKAIRQFGFQDTDIVQVSLSKSQSVGPYHMMKAENPVYLISMESPV